MTWISAVFIIACYLLGSLPFMVLMARAHGLRVVPGDDLHIITWNQIGPLVGFGGVLFDIIVKGMVPIIVGYFLGLALNITLLGAIASLAGQMWPIFWKFDGEKGNTVSLGIFIVMPPLFGYWPLWLIFVPPFIGAVMKVLPRILRHEQSVKDGLKLKGPQSRSLPVGVMIGFLMMPIVSALWGMPGTLTATLAALVLLIIVRRLTAEGLIDDLKTGGRLPSVLLNRFLYDRSFV